MMDNRNKRSLAALIVVAFIGMVGSRAHAAPAKQQTPQAQPQGTVVQGVTTDGRSPAATGNGRVLDDGQKINLNTATFEQLQMLPNIGPKLAQGIINWRQQNGPFKQPEDLMKVPGIRTGRFAKVQAMIYVDDKHTQSGRDPGIVGQPDSGDQPQQKQQTR